MQVETLLSPTTLLWLVVSAIAVSILFGSINRRRSQLTQSLRDYVSRHQESGQEIQSERDSKIDD